MTVDFQFLLVADGSTEAMRVTPLDSVCMYEDAQRDNLPTKLKNTIAYAICMHLNSFLFMLMGS